MCFLMSRGTFLCCLVSFCINRAQIEESAQDVLGLKTQGRKYILLCFPACFQLSSAPASLPHATYYSTDNAPACLCASKGGLLSRSSPVILENSFRSWRSSPIPAIRMKNSPVWDSRCGHLGSVGGENAVVLPVQGVVVVAGGGTARGAAGAQGLLGLALRAAVSGHVLLVEK